MAANRFLAWNTMEVLRIFHKDPSQSVLLTTVRTKRWSHVGFWALKFNEKKVIVPALTLQNGNEMWTLKMNARKGWPSWVWTKGRLSDWDKEEFVYEISIWKSKEDTLFGMVGHGRKIYLCKAVKHCQVIRDIFHTARNTLKCSMNIIRLASTFELDFSACGIGLWLGDSYTDNS